MSENEWDEIPESPWVPVEGIRGVAATRVVSKPGAAVTVTDLKLTPQMKEALTIKGSIPPWLAPEPATKPGASLLVVMCLGAAVAFGVILMAMVVVLRVCP